MSADVLGTGGAAKFLGCSVDAVRYYDRTGALHPDMRLENGARVYRVETLHRFLAARQDKERKETKE